MPRTSGEGDAIAKSNKILLEETMATTAAAASASVTPQQDVVLEEDDEFEEFEQGNRPAYYCSESSTGTHESVDASRMGRRKCADKRGRAGMAGSELRRLVIIVPELARRALRPSGG
jgi:hypothetical protein